jgi:uncharacterized protein YkwD
MSDRAAPAALPRPRRLGFQAPSRLRLVLGMALAISSVGVMATPAITLGWSANQFSSASEQQLLALTNQARASAGRRTLSWDTALASIARWRSKDMIVRNYFSHDIPGAGKVFDEMTARGYCYKVAGENIGWNTYPDDVATAQIQQMFMGSSGHRSNIMATDWDHIGIGAYKGPDGKKMWTILFADKCGSSPVGGKPKPTPRPQPQATPKPKATARPPAAPTATPTAEPTAAATSREIVGDPEVAGAGSGGAGATGGPATTGDAAGTDPAAGISLRTVDRPPSGNLVDAILGGLAGLFSGGG